jgi:predicted RND superfamily exporter protein
MINQESATFLGVLVGLSVDYVVHLALAFQEAPFASRGRRVRVALAEMGVSVLSGALTSMGASALLFLCTIQFFATFGKFMVSLRYFTKLFLRFTNQF